MALFRLHHSYALNRLWSLGPTLFEATTGLPDRLGSMFTSMLTLRDKSYKSSKNPRPATSETFQSLAMKI